MNDFHVVIPAWYPLLMVLPKCFDTLSICALWRPAPPLSRLFFGFRCPPNACGGRCVYGYRPQSAGVPERQRSWRIGSSPSVSRGHVGIAAACTDGPATHRLRILDPTQEGVFTTWLKDRLRRCEPAREVIVYPRANFAYLLTAGPWCPARLQPEGRALRGVMVTSIPTSLFQSSPSPKAGRF